MKWNELFASADELKWIQGVEARLRRKKRLGDAGGISMMALGIIIQLLGEGVDTAAIKKAFLDIYNFGSYLYQSLTGVGSYVYEPSYESIGVVIFLAGIGLVLLFRHTRFLIKESEEPFRYTFWIDEFSCVGDLDPTIEESGEDNGRNTGQMRLLHHDLMEKLNQRIQRLSLLNMTDSKESNETSESLLTAHIHINGNYAIREKKDNVWVIHVMPRVRIGPAGRPSTLAYPVNFLLKNEEGEKQLTADRYNQLFERVYSSVATEVYKQIESDVREKMKLFPTRYLRAVALFNEAEDYVKSNTVDAYDRAIVLYKEALQYFQLAEAKWKTRLLLTPFLWRFRIKFIHMRAKVEIGYAQCLIYRRQLSALSGRYWNPLFEIPKSLERAIYTLEKLHNLIIPLGKDKLKLKKPGTTLSHKERKENRFNSLKIYFGYPGDSWLRRITFRPLQNLFQKQTDLRFEAYVVNALSHFYLEANRTAEQYLKDAKATAPKRSENDPLYLLTAAIIEKDLDEEVMLFRKACEIAPDFEIAQFLLAQNAQMLFHRQDEIEAERAEVVIKKYEEVLKTNPGNIAALTAIGYVYWLVEKLPIAKKTLEEGEETKAMVRQTFTGHLHYGLARIAAEQGEFQDCFDHYSEAILADPGLGVFSMSMIGAYTTTTIGDSSAESNPIKASRAVATHYYELIGPAMLARYEKLKDSVEKKIASNSKKGKGAKIPDETLVRTMNVVHSFVLNDYGNACLNYYLRYTDRAKIQLEQAIEAYEQAIAENKQNKTAYFNLHYAYRYRDSEGDLEKARDCLKKADRLSPTWPVALIASVKSEFRKIQEEINELLKKKEIREKGITTDNGQPYGPSQKVNGQFQQVGGVTSKPTQNGLLMGSPKAMSPKIKDLDADLKPLYNRVEKDVFNEFKRVTAHTKLASLDLDYEGNGVEKLPESDDLKSKLDEFDLNVLEVWVDFLLYKNTETNQRPAQELCKYLQEFYPEHFDYHYLKGNIFYQKGEYGNAVKSFTEAVKISDANDVYYNMLGNAYFNLNEDASRIDNYRQSIKNYHRAIELNGQYAMYSCNLGRAYGALEQWEKMEEHCREAVELRKKTREDTYGLDYYYEFLAEAYFWLKNLKDFEQEFEADNDLQSTDRAWVWNRLGNLMFESKDFDKAINYYNLAITCDNQYPVYLCNIGRAYGELQDWESMADYCRKAVALRKNLPGDEKGLDYYYEFLGEASFNADKLKEFEKKLKSDKDLEPKQRGSVQNQIANLFYNKANYTDAISYYLEAISCNPKSAVYRCNIGRGYGELEEWDKMIAYCAEAVDIRKDLKKDDYDLNYYYEYLAEAYFSAGKIGAFSVGEDVDGKGQARVYNRIANLFFERGDYEDSVPYYQLAIACNPEPPVYKCNIGRTYGNLGEWDKMLQYCAEAVHMRRGLEQDDYDFNYYYEFLADAHFHAGSLEAFDARLENEHDLTDEQKAWIQNRIANLFYEIGSYNEAISYQQKAIILDPLKPIYFSNMGRTHGMLYQWDKMIIHCTKAVELRKLVEEDDFSLGYYYEFLAEAHFNSDKLNEFKTGDDLEGPELAGVENKIGNLFFDTNSFKTAIKYYKKAIASNKSPAIYRSNLGQTYGRLMEWDKMIKHCKEAIKQRKLVEDDFTLKYYYEFLAKALFHANRLNELEIGGDLESADLAHINNQVANQFFESGSYEEAIPYYEKAVAAYAEYPVYRCNLGRAYGNTGDLDNMIKNCRKAVSLRKQKEEDDYDLNYYYEYLAEAYFRSQKIEDFEVKLVADKELESVNQASLYNHIGNLFYGEGSFKKAERYYLQAQKLDPQTIEYSTNLQDAASLNELN